ncbi:MAG: hypothetical protein GC192_23555 [Bacteroidetes bacterium]|nr:hypothetical protein [Bacteroidota bacterium]
MARTVSEIQQSILTAKDADSNLDGLTSTSATAVWKLLVGLFSMAAHLLESMWVAKKIELQEIADSAIPGTAKWYASEVKRWQYGYALTEVDGQLVYLVEDEDAKLVEAVAVVQGSPLYIKVAKDSGGVLSPLSSAERVSLDSFIRDIKFAGTDHVLVSVDPDEVKPTGTVYYDGKLDLDDFKTAFESALESFLKGIYYNGNLNINRYRDAGEAVSGAVDFQLTSLQAKQHGGTYSAVTREYNAVSGYYIHDAAWATGLTYVAA